MAKGTGQWWLVGALGAGAVACGGGSDTVDTETETDTEAPGCPVTCDATGVDSECAAIVDNAGDTSFVLRVTDLGITAPAALTTGLVGDVFAGAFQPQEPACGLDGSETAHWLLQFDTVAGTLTTASGTPGSDGYCVVDAAPVAPVQVDAALQDGALAAAGPFDAVLEVGIGSGQSVLLPLVGARYADVALSDDQNCIGALDPDALDVDADCAVIDGAPRYRSGGRLTGHIRLEDADAVVVASINQSLCVLLTGDPGNGANPLRCTRDVEGVITAAGDWCDSADMASGCTDSIRFDATFAASAVAMASDCGG
jgi:hypothetical protein